jgi:CubicO group peptidase (beta-lactamase class C family)
MLKRITRWLLFFSTGLCVSAVQAQAPPIVNGLPYLPDETLMPKQGFPWAYTIQPSPTPTPQARRDPTSAEIKVVERARTLLLGNQAKAIALIDGSNIVFVEYKAPASEESIFISASMAKTMTALAVGQAICAGKLKMTDRAGDIIPELAKTALGNATVRDLLRMASGAAKPNSPGNPFTGNIFSSEEVNGWQNGTLDLVKVLAQDRISRAERGVFADTKPGEKFSYSNTEPMALGIMLSRVTGMSYAKWVQKTIFDPMGTAGSGWVSQNKAEQALAYAGVQLRMQDWIRFAWWVQQVSQRPDCLGDFVREASHTQIRTGRKFLPGYGYLIWTDVPFAPNTFWAVGYGGQRIGWGHDGNRMVVAFSNLEDWFTELHGLFNEWRNVVK